MESKRKQTEFEESRSSWLAKSLVEMDLGIKQMQKLIEDGKSLSNEDFYHIYLSLAEHYKHLTGETQKNVPLYFQQEEAASGQGSPPVTPDRKLGLHKTGCEVASSTSGGSSDFSLKEGNESSSTSASDSESDSCNSTVEIHLEAPITIDGQELRENVTEEEKASYEELLGQIVNYEDMLRISNSRLQLSEEELTRLKSELHFQTESAQRDIKIRDADLENERRRTFEQQSFISELEARISKSDFEVERLKKELEVCKERLKGSDEEMEQLKYELANEIFEGTQQLQGQLGLALEDVAMLNAKLDNERMQIMKFQEVIARYESNLVDLDNEVATLRVAVSDSEEKFSAEKAKLHSDIFSLLEKQSLSDMRLKEWELQGKIWEDKIRQCEAEKMEMKGLYEAQESGMQNLISQLKVEVSKRACHVEALNKDMDGLKLKYDMLMAEKDELNAKVSTLVAETSSRDNQLGQMEEHSMKLQMEHAKLVAAYETTRNQADEFRQKVKELENEVDRQRMVILDGAEEKREAIKQLCFSLEHYRSGYQELRQAFLGYRRPTVPAA